VESIDINIFCGDNKYLTKGEDSVWYYIGIKRNNLLFTESKRR
jgi:hypothetical protein